MARATAELAPRQINPPVTILKMKFKYYCLFILFVLLPLATPNAEAQPLIGLESVLIEDMNNPADPLTGRGSVSHRYWMMTGPVTNSQYVAFLNAVDPDGNNPNGIYSSFMSSSPRGGILRNLSAPAGSVYSVKANFGDKPVNMVTWFDAARFANWMHNGAEVGGDMETGAYNLNGATSGIFVMELGAKFWLPTWDEWYKAAYYDPVTQTYSLYPTQFDTVPTQATVDAFGNITNPGDNVANFGNSATWNVGSGGNVTTIGSAGNTSFYGTYDQGGNVSEWTGTVAGSQMRILGGNYFQGDSLLASTSTLAATPTAWASYYGFRLAIPEPSSVILMLLASGAWLLRRRRH